MNNTKQCSTCKKIKNKSCFGNKSNTADKLRTSCKSCEYERCKTYGRTKIGLLSQIYNNQRVSSKTRGHNPPLYTRADFIEWALSLDNFDILFQNWKSNNFSTDYRPSFDRLDDKKSYTFENIQLVTWKENKNNEYYRHKKGISERDLKPVNQYTLEMKLISKHISLCSASRETGVHQSNITKCTKGQRKTAGGFIWILENETPNSYNHKQ